MRSYSAADLDQRLNYSGLVAALADYHRAPPPLIDRAEQHFDTAAGDRQSFLNLPAWLPGRAMGVKSIAVIPGNEERRGMPTVHATYVVFDGETGEPSALIDGTVLTYYKTAADSALGAQLLARDDARVLVMAGAGAMAEPLITAHRAVRSGLERVFIWNRTAAKARSLAERLDGAGIAAEAADDLEAAVRDADIVSCAMSSTEPYIDGEWLKPGSHLDLVGSFTPDMRECNDAAVSRASVFVDSRWFAVHDPGDICQPLAAGVITEDDILADLFDLCCERHPGRTRDDEITLFKNGGGAHLDLFTALHVIDGADGGDESGASA